MSERRVIGAEEARTRASEYEDELLGLTESLLRIPSPFGTSGEGAQAVVAEYLEQHGFEATALIVDPTKYSKHPEFMPPGNDSPALNLICRPRDGVAAAREVLFAHIDTPEVRGGAPSEAGVRGDSIYGLGVADDKAGVAACAVAAAILRDGGYPAPTVLSVHAKGGGARGTLAMVQDLRDIDAALYVHPAETGRGLGDIKHVSRGVLDISVRVSGWAGHEREPGNPETVPVERRGSALDTCIAILDRWRETTPGGTVVLLGALRGGEHPGTTAVEAIARARVLFDGMLTTDHVLAWLNREAAFVIARRPRVAGEAYRAAVSAEGLCANPAATAVDTSWYQAVHSGVTAVTSRAPDPYNGHLCSDIRFPIRLLGLPCVGIGPVAGNFHTGEEWVDVPDLIRTVAAIVLAVCWFDKEQSCPHVS